MKIPNAKEYCIIILMMGVRMAGAVPADEIHQAASSGDLNKITALLTADSSLLNRQDAKGNTPLHCAASKGRSNVISFLIDQGADMEIRNVNGLTPLLQALDLSRNESAKLLVEMGANTEVRGYRNRTLLHAAARSGNVPITQLLLQKNAEINARDGQNATPLDLAVEARKKEVGLLLIENGAKLNNFKASTPAMDQMLNLAVNQGQTDVIQLFNRAGILLNEQTQSGHHYIHKAAAWGCLDIVQSLTDHGEDINVLSADGRTPLDYADRYGHPQISEWIRSRGGKTTYSPAVIGGGLEPAIPVGTVHIWYLNHSAWAVRTQNHFLIFDYTTMGKKPVSAGLINGYIKPEELHDLKVTVFVSHIHDDHYDSQIFDWSRQIPDIRFIIGQKPPRIDDISYIYMGAGSHQIVDGLKIQTINSTDAGVGFLVSADGITIYHAGDHANKSEKSAGPYHKEIDILAASSESVDIAFVLAGAACGGRYLDCVLKGDFYAIEKLNPKAVFPMHSGANELVYHQFKKDAAAAGIKNEVVAVSFRGDHYIYQNGRLRNIE